MTNIGIDTISDATDAANQPSGAASQQQEWDSEHLQEAEKTLKEMYIQVCHPLSYYVQQLM